MNICDEAPKNNLHFSLKETELPSGEVRIDCAELSDKHWIGPSRAVVLKKVQDDLYERESKRQVVQMPTCFTDGSFSGVLIRE